MIILLTLICVWNFLMILVIVSRVNKLNQHHHGGFTNNGLQFREKENR